MLNKLFNEIVPTAMAQITQVTPSTTDPQAYIVSILSKVKNVIVAALGIIVVIMILWAGWDFITAAGDPAKVKSAKNKIIYAIIGIAVMSIAAAVPAIVANFVK